MKCPYCGNKLYTVYINGPRKIKMAAGKICVIHHTFGITTSFFDKLQIKKKRELENKRKKPIIKHKTRCHCCRSTHLKFRKIHTKPGQTQSWKVWCLDCDMDCIHFDDPKIKEKYWTQNWGY